MATKPAKALLHEFFQPLQGTPLFSIRPGPPPPAPPHFLCTLTIPAITTAQYSFASQVKLFAAFATLSPRFPVENVGHILFQVPSLPVSNVQEFTGEANNKRAAEHAASQAALNFLNSLRPGGKMQTPQTIAAAEVSFQINSFQETYLLLGRP